MEQKQWIASSSDPLVRNKTLLLETIRDTGITLEGPQRVYGYACEEAGKLNRNCEGR